MRTNGRASAYIGENSIGARIVHIYSVLVLG